MKVWYVAVVCFVTVSVSCATTRVPVDNYEAFTHIEKLVIVPNSSAAEYLATMSFLERKNVVLATMLTDDRFAKDGIKITYSFDVDGRVLDWCSIEYAASDFREWSNSIESRWRDSGDAIMVSSEAVRDGTGGALLAGKFSTFREGVMPGFYYRITQRLMCLNDHAYLALGIDYVYEQVY